MRSTVSLKARPTESFAVRMPTSSAMPSAIPAVVRTRAQQVLAEVGPGDQAQQDHRRTSPAMRASRRVTVRGQLSATVASWVTIRTVALRRWCRSWISFRMSAPVWESRLPVGSSASRIGRVKREGAGDGDALPLAAGELVGQVIEAMAELHQFEQLAGALVDVAARQPFEVQRQGDVLDAGQAGEQVEELEDEADLVAAQAGEVVVGERGDGLPVDADFAGGRAGRVRRSD